MPISTHASSTLTSGWRGFGRILARKHFSPFKTYVNRRHRTVVVLNPKVGTKSFRQALTDGMREIHGITDPSEGRYRLFKKAREFQFAPLADYAHAFRFASEYQFFCFVRNPYARLRSAWQNKFADGHEQGYSRSIRRRELGRLRRYATQAELPGAQDGSAIPFTTFLAYVESQPSGKRDHHWDDQHHVLLMRDIRYECCFRMEGEFTAGMQQIFARIGLHGAAIEKILATQKNVSPPVSNPVYSAAIAARVYRLYTEDFKIFAYDAESWRGL
jgi:Sulfotransferase family